MFNKLSFFFKKNRSLGALVIVLSFCFVFGQNCGRASLRDTTAEATLSALLSSTSVPSPIILSAMKIIELLPNTTKYFSLEVEPASAPIAVVAFDDKKTVFTKNTLSLNQIQINRTTNEIQFTPRPGFQGMDQTDLYVFGADGNFIQTTVIFVVRNAAETLSEINTLVYGADDRVALANKLAGAPPPGMSEIFVTWGRFAGDDWFPRGTTPTGEAASWEMLPSPDRISCPVNSKEFTGFVSLNSFDSYTHRASLTSVHRDDDAIAIIIAFTRIDGVIYTLSAFRTNGHLAPQLGWGLVYSENGVQKKIFGERSVDGVHRNSLGGTGWSNRKSIVQVERDGDVIEASTSNWHVDESFLALVPSSKITLDLNSDPLLIKFKGPKPYGYGSHSQAGTTFLDVYFSAGTSERYVYDLLHNLVYEGNNGNYVLRTDIDAYSHIGYPRRVGNPETGKVYQLYPNKTYQLAP